MNKNNGVQFVGIVACVPKGDWQSNLTYDLLNIVRHNGASYIATTTVPANNEPSLNSKYWNLLVKDGENGSGSSITIDDFLSLTSTNPVQNKVIALALNEKQAILVSGVNIKTINNQSILGEGDLEIDEITVDSGLSDTSTNPVENRAVTEEFAKKVGFTDYAIQNKAGVVKVSASGANGIYIGREGNIGIDRANDALIKNKLDSYKPIVPINLDYAVKVGVTTNTLELTDEEKANALAWLGASSTKWYKHNILVNIQNVTYYNMEIITTSQEKIEYNGNGLIIQGTAMGTMYYGAGGSTSNELQYVGILLPFAETYYPTIIDFGASGLPQVKNFISGSFFPSDVTEFIDTPTEL